MRKAAKQIIAAAVLLLIGSILCRVLFFGQFSLYIPMITEKTGRLQVQVTDPQVLTAGEPEIRSNYVRISVTPQGRGEADLLLVDEESGIEMLHPLKVGRFHTVYDLSSGNFTGDTAVLFSTTLFWLLVCAIMIWHFLQARGPLFYDYATIYYSGFALFALSSGLVLMSVTIVHLARPEQYSMMDAYSAIRNASTRYMMFSTPLVLVFAVVMAISNIALLRHMRFRMQNVLGLVISGLIIAGEALGWHLFTRDFMGSEAEYRMFDTLSNTYATVFIYFQCMLTGSVISGIVAAKRQPAPDKDFIIINGCWFRPDGSLPPLIRSRADRALAFWRGQKAATGKEARFIPSGGQGENETMAEAEALRRYLVSEGIDDRLILPECRSANTYENMAFSREIIQETVPAGKAVFATSSYHVFRTGLWSRLAGLSAEGIGGRTKWWFWPNAFMRETIGLLQKRWKQELLFLLLLIAFFGALSMLLW